MSNHNSETVMLSEANRKGTIIEPRRTLTFPIPDFMQDWNRIRFGLAFSLTDLENSEALLDNISTTLTSNDGTESTFWWTGLTTNSEGVLPLRFGSEDWAFVLGPGSNESQYRSGSQLSSRGVIRVLGQRQRSLARINGNSVQSSSQFSVVFGADGQNIIQNGDNSVFHSTRMMVYWQEFFVENLGSNDTQALGMSVKRFQPDSEQGVPVGNIDYENLSSNSLVTAVMSNHDNENSNTIPWTHEGVALPIPQNIIFHWPFFDLFRLRLHGAVLIKRV